MPLRVLVGEHRQYPQGPGAGHRQPRAQKSLHARAHKQLLARGMETSPSAKRQDAARRLAEGITFCLVRIRPPDGALSR
ncbi:hypothetical protein [Paenibacillus xylanexedens]|uniref:hypothetical protein n=1 Tax=Paenibacillus xylanexedens TaxID=528191 RepID=UPI0011A238F3|nr:hypothetical protein [Paenibacillus xylanexedens]